MPGPVQRALATALSPVGRLAGYRARYPEYEEGRAVPTPPDA
ncbi:hypothetical protein [Halorussus sp. MSC15.2]|nr:hypothetical protein [Halorussus sp. MSC15.2]